MQQDVANVWIFEYRQGHSKSVLVGRIVSSSRQHVVARFGEVGGIHRVGFEGTNEEEYMIVLCV